MSEVGPSHRLLGYRLLSGRGLEIGALHQPAELPTTCSIEYLAVAASDEIRLLFPELANEKIVFPDWVGDLTKRNITEITGKMYDFVIINHVLEHVPNPIKLLQNVWGGIVDGGRLVVAAPDKRFTFDSTRHLTDFKHLLAEYYQDANDLSDDHYIDFLANVHPAVFESRETFVAALTSVRKRREHAHVWDSSGFRDFITRTLNFLGYDAKFDFESDGEHNKFEYFGILRKVGHNGDLRQALTVLLDVYSRRPDLQRTFPGMSIENCATLIRWIDMARECSDSDFPLLAPYQSVLENQTVFRRGKI